MKKRKKGLNIFNTPMNTQFYKPKNPKFGLDFAFGEGNNQNTKMGHDHLCTSPLPRVFQIYFSIGIIPLYKGKVQSRMAIRLSCYQTRKTIS